MSVIVSGRYRGGVGGDAEVVGPVVLDEEGAVGPDDIEDFRCGRSRPLGSGRVRVVRLGVERPGSGFLERAGDVLRVGTRGSGYDRDEADACLCCGEDRSPVGG